MRRTELLVAGVAGLGLMVAIIADAAQQRFLRYAPEFRPDVPGEISGIKAEEAWPGVNLDTSELSMLAYGGTDGLSADAVARIAAIAPAAGGGVADADVAQLTVRQLIQDALALASDPALGPSARVVKYRQLLLRDFDVALMARFALGRHWRGADAEQRQRYLTAFTDHLLDSYAGRLRQDDLAAIELLGTQAAGKQDVMVESRIHRATGERVQVFWRLRPRDGQFRIIDVVIEGVSLALTKRQEFAAITGANGNDVGGLIRKLAENS